MDLSIKNNSWIFTPTYDKLYNNTYKDDTISSIYEINTNLKSTISAYDEAKKSFYDELNSNLSDLKTSIAEIKNIDYSKDKNSLQKVHTLVDKYNQAHDFFTEHKDISKRIKHIDTTFDDFSYYANNYNMIGLSVNEYGKILINDDKLQYMIDNKAYTVNDILTNFVNKTDTTISNINMQYDKLFPDINTMLKDQIKTANIYTSNAFLNINFYTNVGNIINMFS